VWRNTSPIFDAVMAFYEGSKVNAAAPTARRLRCCRSPRTR
jgi:hypothetical protein